MATSNSQSEMKYPSSSFFILGGYLTERIVYYSMFGGGVFYMQRMLGFTSSTATTVKAVLEGLIYFAPIFGAFLADTYFGKVRMVFMMCCGYIVGTIIFTLSSVTPIMATVTAAKFTGIFGLLALGLCTGLMKAAYCSLGGDQFKVPEQRKQQKRFFYGFYWMINVGAFAGQFMTAQLRDTVQCFGDDCYLLPYVIAVIVMIVSTAIFAAGRSRYIESPPDTTLINAVKCIRHAIRKSWDEDKKPVMHWLDRSLDKFDTQLIKDVKKTLRLLILFCTYPIFWALFYQTSTGMIFQAKRLNGLVGDSYRIPPEMSSTVNPLLILTLIPLFDLLIYPCLDRIGYLTRTTSRMVVGMFFAVTAFVVYAIVNTQVEQTLIPQDHARIHIYNALPCEANIKLPEFSANLASGGQILTPEFLTIYDKEVRANIEPSCETPDMSQVPVVTLGGHETTLLILPSGVKSLSPTLEYIKSEDAEAKVRVLMPSVEMQNVTLQYETLEKEFQVKDGMTAFQPVSPQEYNVMVKGVSVGEAPVYQDGVYDIVLTNNSLFIFKMTAPSDLHMMWLLPQYVLLTIGEILFSVSSMDFAYSEAPLTMKATLQAAELFTITVGLWLLAGLTTITSAAGVFQHRASHEALLYASLMAVNTVIFALLLRRYRRLKEESNEGEDTTDNARNNKLQSRDNKGFVEDDAV